MSSSEIGVVERVVAATEDVVEHVCVRRVVGSRLNIIPVGSPELLLLIGHGPNDLDFPLVNPATVSRIRKVQDELEEENDNYRQKLRASKAKAQEKKEKYLTEKKKVEKLNMDMLLKMEEKLKKVHARRVRAHKTKIKALQEDLDEEEEAHDEAEREVQKLQQKIAQQKVCGGIALCARARRCVCVCVCHTASHMCTCSVLLSEPEQGAERLGHAPC